jgi:uncharacterized protein YndB with AHSA1/START domain
MGAQADAVASRTLDVSADDVWPLVSDGTRVAGWWPMVERAEDVRGGRFTLVLRSSRGVPVRTDWRVTASRRPELQRWEQELQGTPFQKALQRSAVEVRLERTDHGGCRVSVAVERTLVSRGAIAGLLGRRAAKRQAGDALARLVRAARTPR